MMHVLHAGKIALIIRPQHKEEIKSTDMYFLGVA